MSVRQGYESTKGRNDYRTSTGITYRGQGQPMDIGKSNKNFKNRKLKCFNCNKYRYMAKDVTNLRLQGWPKERTLYRVYTRELNRELCTRLSTLYMSTVKITTGGLSSSPILFFHFLFYFHAALFFYFSIFRMTRVKGDWSRCHISHNLMVQSRDRAQDLREFSRRFENR